MSKKIIVIADTPEDDANLIVYHVQYNLVGVFCGWRYGES